jgi:hypothetical protein
LGEWLVSAESASMKIRRIRNMNDNDLSLICSHGGYSRPERLRTYVERYLFEGIDLRGKSLLDIGGGAGTFSFCAAASGASRVVVMEPEADGSSSGVGDVYQRIHRALGSPSNITRTTEVLEQMDRKNNKFDIILMHNSINHIDEDACVRLPIDREAQAKYLSFFDLLGEVSNTGTSLIVCDCSNRNFWVDVMGRNPLAKTIEWEKHQPPEFWSSLLSQRGFRQVDIAWGSPNVLGGVGRLLLGNRLAAYLTFSHFRLEMVRS